MISAELQQLSAAFAETTASMVDDGSLATAVCVPQSAADYIAALPPARNHHQPPAVFIDAVPSAG